MSTVVVVIDTEHLETDDAVRSVSAAMKRAGYDVLDYVVHENAGLELHSMKAILTVCEPEVNSARSSH